MTNALHIPRTRIERPKLRRSIQERPVLQLPIARDPEGECERRAPESEEGTRVERGVAVIDFYV